MPSDHLPGRNRRTRFESFEERLALSANPVANLLPLGDGGPRIEHHYGELLELPAPATRGDFSLERLEEIVLHDDFVLEPLLNDAHTLTGLNAVRNAYGFMGHGQTVAIIDSGIAYDHHALGSGFGSSYRVVGGWDFAENDANPYDDGPAGFHGTHVAGIVGSSNENYYGVASGVDLVALRVFDDSGTGYFSWTEQALQWVHEHRNDFANPITTVNLSLGTNWNSDVPPEWAMLEDEFARLEEDGIFISVSAGNSFTNYNTAGLSYPAASPHVVPVASVDNSGGLSYFSQRNASVIAAPGRSIVSTVPDHVVGADGVVNDFASASGTSMAAPYVAGASALVREAMEFLGYTEITQGTIYDHLRDTADVIYDSVTNSNYYRLHIQRAIEALMPADDYGDSAETAHSLGSITAATSFEGALETLEDIDYFSFTSTQPGRITFTATSSNEAQLQLSRVGGAATISGNQLSFDVVAGQSYTIGLASPDAITRYEVDAEIVATATDLGTVAYELISDQNVSGSRSYRLTATRDGVLTVQASFEKANGDVNLEVRDSNRNLLNAARTANSVERVDIVVTAGQVILVDVVGTNVDVDLCLANLVQVADGAVEVWGTDEADTFEFADGVAHTITVNGLRYRYAAGQNSSYAFHGGDGNDSLRFDGSRFDDTVTLTPGTARYANAAVDVTGDSFESCNAYSGGGNDTCRFYDSAGDDEFFATSTFGRLTGTGFYSYAEGFASIYAYAQAGGNDHASIHDTAANDAVIMTTDFTTLNGGSIYRYAGGFESVAVRAILGGDDRLDLFGTDQSDRVISSANSSTLDAGGRNLQSFEFDRVYVYAGAGDDRLDIYDSAVDDELVMSAEFSRITSSVSYRYAEGFERQYAYSSTSGDDRVSIYDTSGDDEIIMTPVFSRLAGSDFYAYVSGFDRVEAYSREGNDRADLYDSAGNDHFLATPSYARMTGDGYYNYAVGFARMSGFATAGGIDQADLYGSGVGDELIARPQFSRLSGNGYYHYAQGFERTAVYSGNAADDMVPQASSRLGENSASINQIASMTTDRGNGSSTITLYGFGYIKARSRMTEYTFQDVAAVDFLFEQMGDEP